MHLINEYLKAESYSLPYTSSEELICDLLSYLDFHLHIFFLIQHSTQDENGNFLLRGSKLTKVQLEKMLSSSFEADFITLSDSTSASSAEARSYIEHRISLTESPENLSFLRMCKLFALNSFERFCLLLGIAVFMNRKYETIFGYLNQNTSMIHPTFGLAISLYDFIRQTHHTVQEIQDEIHSDFNRFFVDAMISPDAIVLAESFQIKHCVWRMALGYDQSTHSDNLSLLHTTLYPVSEEMKPLSIHLDTYEKLHELMVDTQSKYTKMQIYLQGQSGIGKTFLARHLAHSVNASLITIDYSYLSLLYKTNPKAFHSYMEQLSLELSWHHALVGIHYNTEQKSGDEDDREREHDSFLSMLLCLFEESQAIYFIFSEEKCMIPTTLHHPQVFYALPFLSLRDRNVLWHEIGAAYELCEDVDLDLHASKYVLTPFQIQQVFASASLYAQADHKLTSNNTVCPIAVSHLLTAIKQQNMDELASFATQIEPIFTWDDLIVSERTGKKLHAMCNQIFYRSKVGDEWGFFDKTPYGKGLCALFYGSPGTGKTMAAQVIANNLGLDLYRIDLSRIVSKYIGETEKNISGLFEKAKHMNALLFFDEADSLFAKRSDVSDSNDRNANAETGHLLQQIENYDGVAILATNLMSNMDDAFKRRIKFIINFELPDAKTRLQLWKSMIPAKAQCDEVIDFDFFAQKYELAPSSIKEITINAAFLAVAEGTGIKNRHIVEALISNYEKYGKLIGLGEFQHLL